VQSGTVFDVWKDGEIHPTAVRAISGLGFDSLSNLQIGWHCLDVMEVLLIVGGVCCLQSLRLPAQQLCFGSLSLPYILTCYLTHPDAFFKH